MVSQNSVGRLTLPESESNQRNPSTSTSASNSTSRSQLPPIGRSSTSTSTPIKDASEDLVKIRAQEKDCAFPNKKEATKALKSYNEKANENRLKGLWDGVIKVGKGEGIRGLWRGLSPTL